MKKKYINSALLTIALFVGIIYGIAMHKFEVFPYVFIRGAFRTITNQEPVDSKTSTKIEQDDFYNLWSVGIYEGITPFNLVAPKDVINPILTAKDVKDMDATYIADPFMAIKDSIFYLFFEAFNWESHHADISYAKSNDGKHWEYKGIVIDEPFHLSYPYIFEWENDYYLIPESSMDLSVRLYKASSFPDKWEYIGKLLSGHRFVDPSIFTYNNKWWLFVSNNNDILNLYYSDELLGKWEAHQMNPIVKFNDKIARPGGRVITYNNKLYRFAQDDHESYGNQIIAFEITELTEKTYVEKMATEEPIITMTGKDWNAAGMHHVDLHKVGKQWIAAVDGRNR